MKTGLILEGGAMRGLFTAGVMDVMMERGISYDGIIGVSAGAAFGCNYLSGQIGRVLRYNTQFCRDKRYCGLRPLLKNGNIYSTDFCYGEVPLKLDVFDFAAFEHNPTRRSFTSSALTLRQANRYIINTPGRRITASTGSGRPHPCP